MQKQQGLKGQKFETLSPSQMSRITGGGLAKTGPGETATRYFKSDNEYRDSSGKLIYNDVTYADGTQERKWLVKPQVTQ